jgi:hypothetical protein
MGEPGAFVRMEGNASFRKGCFVHVTEFID